MSTGSLRAPFGGKRRKPWGNSVRGLEALLRSWGSSGVLRDVTLQHAEPPKPADEVPIPSFLAPNVSAALKSRGIERLYRHQAEALQLGREGRSFVVATPTASGKSLCYNLPILDRLSQEEGARALYLFPTKALSRDQEEALRALLSEADLGHGAITYDGDTPGDQRRVARERGGVVLSNPDMLHASVLPHHASWARFFANLRFVVIDELHAYRGVFGSHLSNVIRRLRRICAFHGSSPTFVLASATIGNPREHAARIVGEKVALLDKSGAPTGERNVLVYNPPIVNAELGLRGSYLKSAVRLTVDLIKAEVPTLVFGRSRNSVEVMLKYLRDRLKGQAGFDPNAIHAYRGGYLPKERRAIEKRLRSGDIRCVV
ncbi:MAG: DEAD/DEAH box helicase, partial [Myxococcota bacterium]